MTFTIRWIGTAALLAAFAPALAFAQTSDATAATAPVAAAAESPRGSVAAGIALASGEPARAANAPDAARVAALSDPDAAAQGQPAAAEDDDEDKILDPAQPDFTLIALPTGLRLPRFRSAFRVTHRFVRPLGQGSFGNLASDLFGLDSGAQIGLEYRFGLMRGTQIDFYRTNDRTIQFLLERDVVRQRGMLPVGITALAFVEGTNNFKDSYSPGLGAILSRTVADALAVYVEPIWVNNSNPLPEEIADDNDTFMVGIGGRFRVRPTVYLSAEVTPRAAGFKGGPSNTTPVAFGLEKRAGGHLFQLNVGNSIGTTFANIARGGSLAANGNRNWFLGFNISRKFY